MYVYKYNDYNRFKTLFFLISVKYEGNEIDFYDYLKLLNDVLMYRKRILLHLSVF